MTVQNKRKTGAFYESQAAEYLEKQGYRILDKNFRTRFGEVDIIGMSPDKVLVFVEVKYRHTLNAGDPLEAVDFRKQRQISRTAAWYLARKNIALDCQMRFDVIGITGDGQLRHVQNAFEYVM